jgi:glucokinase
MTVILAGDVGGTKTNLAFFRYEHGELKCLTEQKFASHDYGSLYEIIARFLASQPLRPDCACFGVAGPVDEGRSRAVNLAWEVDVDEIRFRFGILLAAVINDLEATACALGDLTADDFAVLNEGVRDPDGALAVISAGTGLGEAGLHWEFHRYRPFASEGGHTTFSPENDLEIELLAFLRPQFGHVSWERVLSGPGLVNIYRFLSHKGLGEIPPELADRIDAEGTEAAPLISEAAMAGIASRCEQALELFVSFYGAEAGNLALTVMATGGVYVGGGIAPKILPRLTDGTFMSAFVDKGRMRPLLEKMPVRVILNEKAPLLGAARYATL